MIRPSTRLSFLLLVFAAALTASAGAAQTPTADDIVEKHLAALGGREALGKLTSRRSTGTIQLSTPAVALSGTVEISLKAPNKSRSLIRLDMQAMGGGEMVVDQRFDGVKGVALNSVQGDMDITGNQLDNMRNNAFPSALLTYKTTGTKIELLPQEKLNGKDAVVLLITPKTGSVVRSYLDAGTLLQVRTVAKITPANVGTEIEQTIDLSDYRTVDGVKVPFSIVTTNPLQMVTIALTKVEHNVAIDDAIFVK